MIKHTVMEFIHMLTVLVMKVIGKKISKKVMEKKLGLMALRMKEIILMVKKAEKVFLDGQMGVCMKGNFWIIILMGEGLIRGEIKENMLVIGNVIKWKDMDCSLGLMGEFIKGSIKMIKKMGMDCLNGVMGKSIKVIGKMENRMVKGSFIIHKLMFGENVWLKMGKELDGWMKNK